MLSKEEVDQTLENYEKIVTRAQHVFNRLYKELYTKYSDKYWNEAEPDLFQGIESGYDMQVKRSDKPEDIDFGTSDTDRGGDYIGYVTFKREFLYNDEALTAYIKSEIEKREEEDKRKREAEAAKRKRDAEKKEAEERALFEKLKAKYGDN